jgi:hypothetical protein
MPTPLRLEGDGHVPEEVARSAVAVAGCSRSALRAREAREHANAPALLMGACELAGGLSMFDALRARSDRVRRRARQFARRRA